MSDTILRKAHMSAVREVSSLNAKIRRLEAGMIVAQCMNQYLAARVELFSKPYKMDRAIVGLGQAAIDAENEDDMNLAIGGLQQLLKQARLFTLEAMKEIAGELGEKYENATGVEGVKIIHQVLQRVDDKMAAYKEEMTRQLGLSPEDMEQIRREIEEKFGRPGDSE